MKLVSNLILVGTLLSSSTGFSVEEGAGVAQEAAVNEEQAFNFSGLPLEIQAKIFGKLKSNDLGPIASTSSQMRALAQETISKLDDGVLLRGGSWMRLRTALDNGKISEIVRIKDLHTLLNSSVGLRNSFMNAVATKADEITSNVDLSEENQGNRNAFHKHVLGLGLSSTLADFEAGDLNF